MHYNCGLLHAKTTKNHRTSLIFGIDIHSIKYAVTLIKRTNEQRTMLHNHLRTKYMTKKERMEEWFKSMRMPTMRQIGYFITGITLIFGGCYYLLKQQTQLELLQNGRKPLMFKRLRGLFPGSQAKTPMQEETDGDELTEAGVDMEATEQTQLQTEQQAQLESLQSGQEDTDDEELTEADARRTMKWLKKNIDDPPASKIMISTHTHNETGKTLMKLKLEESYGASSSTTFDHSNTRSVVDGYLRENNWTFTEEHGTSIYIRTQQIS